MINYKEELSKYEPILEVDEIEDALHANELQDMFDILQHIAKQNSSSRNVKVDTDTMDKE